jgi:hypothetical protein
MLFIPLIYPSGRPEHRWDRRLVTLAIVGYVALFTSFAFKPGVLDLGEQYPVQNPLGLEPLQGVLRFTEIFIFGLLIAFIGGIISLLIRMRGSSGIEKQHLKWFAFGALFTLLMVFVVSQVLFALFSDVSQSAGSILSNVTFGIGVSALPASMGVAVLRYRLYDLGRLVNRAVVYLTLTVILGSIYLLGITVMRSALSPITGDSDLAVAASTLAVAGLFRPVRRRVQTFIDQRFYRRKYDAGRTVDEFSSKLRNEIDLRTLNDELVGVVHQTMHPTHVSVWLRPSRES